MTSGCGSSEDRWVKQRPKVVPATGVVRYKGQPLAGATVNFTNVDADRTAFAITNAAGRFALTTFVTNDGAVPGPQQVTVRKTEVMASTEPVGDASESLQTVPPAEERWLIPQRYSHPTTSELTAMVTDGGVNEFTFDLSD